VGTVKLNEKRMEADVHQHAAKILEGVYFGSIHAAHDINFLQQHNIGMVINVCEQSYSFPQELQHIKLYHLLNDSNVPLDDKLFDNELSPEDFFKFISRASDLILEAVEAGICVLVHCADGVNRSVACIMGYLLIYEELPYDQALALVTQANSTRTYAFCIAQQMVVPDNDITFPTLNNTDFREALKYLKGAFAEGQENQITLAYINNWQENYLSTNMSEM